MTKSYRFAPAALLLLLPALASAAAVTRGPFLQLPGEQTMTIVWKTDTATDSIVRYGTSPAALTQTVSLPTATTTHVVKLANLNAATKYFYSVGSSAETLASGPEYYLKTNPVAGSARPFRFFAWGDSGDGSTWQMQVAAQMDKQLWRPDFALILGDIVYPGGEPQNYDPHFFTPYKNMLRNTVAWPTLGNHDVVTQNGAPYFDAFYLPTNNPAGKENYYSFDYANAHFVCIDSQTEVEQGASATAMLAWLDQDLANSKAKFKFAYFHHPPYSGGSHPDDYYMKKVLVPVMDKYGVDMIFTGHSHVYERTYLLKAGAILQKDPVNYSKVTTPDGSIYVVTGAGGEYAPLSNPSHPLMAIQRGNVTGNTIIDVDGDTLHGFYLLRDGTSIDLFTLTKDGDKQRPRVAAFSTPSRTQLKLSFTEPVGSSAATIASNYKISPAVAVTAAALDSDGRTVTLTTASHPDGAYTLTLANIADRASPPNAIAPPDDQVPYTFGVVTPPGPDAGTPPGPDAGTPPGPDAGPAAGPDAGNPDDGGQPSTGELELVDPSDGWRYLKGNAAPPATWSAPDFDDTAWVGGNQPLGYDTTGAANLGTSLADMKGGYRTVYMRHAFWLPATLQDAIALTLEVAYDAGFVAYLNGVEIARRNVPAGQTNATLASAPHAAGPGIGTMERFDVSKDIALLQGWPGAAKATPGLPNVLAIELHVASDTSPTAFLNASMDMDATQLPPPFATDAWPTDGASLPMAPDEIRVHLKDDGPGLAASSVRMTVNDLPVDAELTGDGHDGVLTYKGAVPEGPVHVEVNAANTAGAAMAPYRWSFTVLGATQVLPNEGESPLDNPAPAKKACGCSSGLGSMGFGAGFALLALVRRRRRRT